MLRSIARSNNFYPRFLHDTAEAWKFLEIECTADFYQLQLCVAVPANIPFFHLSVVSSKVYYYILIIVDYEIHSTFQKINLIFIDFS